MTANCQPHTANTAPKRGWVNTFYRYHNGKKLGPYYVRRWKLNGKVHKQYIKPQDVEKVKAECQTHRERKKAVVGWLNNTIANFNYIDRMIKWADQGKLRPADHAYISRIKREGFKIDGRPPIRKKIVRSFATYNGQAVVLKTVFEPDGTTKTFMVPFFAKYLKGSSCRQLFLEGLDQIEEQVLRAVNEMFEKPGQQPPNPWLQPPSRRPNTDNRSLITDY